MGARHPRDGAMVVDLNVRPLRATDLNVHVRYLSPSRRMCRLMPQRTHGIGSNGSMFLFEYADKPGDGFWLTAGNVHIMRAL